MEIDPLQEFMLDAIYAGEASEAMTELEQIEVQDEIS